MSLEDAAHRTITGLDGAYPPPFNAAHWAANPGGKKIARFLLDLVIRATTALADDPVITARPYIKHGGDFGYAVAAGESVSFARPRLKDDAAQIKAQFTTDAGGTYTNNSAEVNDNTTGVMTLNSLDTIANGDWVILGGPAPFCGAALDVTNANGNAATFTAEYWNGSAWTALSNLTNGHAIAFGGDAQVTWDMPAAGAWAASTINSISSYWVRLGISAAADSSVTLTEVDLLFPIQAAIDVQADGDDATLMLESLGGSATGTIAYSGTTRVSWR